MTVDFGVSNEDYWSDPLKMRDEIETRLIESGQETLAVGAPSTVYVDSRSTLPVVVLRTAKLDTMARNKFREKAVIAAMDLSSDHLYAYMAIVNNALPTPAYTGPPLSGMGGEALVVDARRQLKLPWSGHNAFVISAILGNQTSNRVRVEMKKSGYEDPAVIEYLRKRQVPEMLDVWPEAAPEWTDPFDRNVSTIPDYTDRVDSPPIPDKPDIALAAARVEHIAQRPSCVVLGSFRLPAQQRYAVPGSRSYSAVVPITILVTGSQTGFPYLFPLRVPSKDRIGNDPNASLTGYFAIDLCALSKFIHEKETFFAYAFSGSVMSKSTRLDVLYGT